MEKLEHSSLSAYLRKLYDIEPLTLEEEVQLSTVIQKGLKAREKLEAAADAAEYEKLEQQVWEGDAARNKLVEHNLRFTPYVLKKTPSWIYGNMPMEDLISEGNIAMIKAAEKWVPQPGIKFVGYSRRAIEGAAVREVEKHGFTIRISSNAHEQIRKIKYNEALLIQQLLREPTLEELSEKTEISVKRIKELGALLLMQPTSLDISSAERLDLSESEE